MVQYLPSIGQLSMNQPPILSQPSTCEITFTQGQNSIPSTRATHMLRPSGLLGHTMPFSSHNVSNVATLVPISSSMYLLSSSQVGNPLVVT